MTCTDTVHIVFLHQLEILKHSLTAHIVACIRVGLMKIHSLELDRLTVHIEDVSFDLKTAESDIETGILALYTKKKSIKLRSLCRPFPYILHYTFHHCLAAVYKTTILKYDLTILVQELVRHIKVTGWKSRKLETEQTVLASLIKGRNHIDIELGVIFFR